MNKRKLSKIIVLCATVCVVQNVSAETVGADSVRQEVLEPVVVTGSNSAIGKNLLPYSVTTISNAEIQATGSTQLLSAVSGQVPSLFVSERNILGFGLSNGGSGGIKIRGVGGAPTNAILMMVDGQPQFAGLYSHHVADFYKTDYVERVEILRGPASVLYGSNAMGGVVNVITKGAKEDGIKTSLTSQYGSYNTWLSSLTNTVRKGKFSSLLSLAYDKTDGTQDNFDFKQGSVYAKIGYDFSNEWKAKADYSFMNFVGNDPIYATLSNSTATSVYHQNILRGEASVSVGNYYSKTNGDVRVYYSYGNHYIDDPNHFHSLDDRFGVLAYQNFTPWKRGFATVGFDFDTYTGKIPKSGGHVLGDGSQAALMQTISRKSTTEYSPYLTLSQHLWGEVLTLNVGLRMANSDRFETQWVPQGGFSLQPAEGWNIKGSVAMGYRNPSFKEMYLYMMANPDLDPEKMMNYELSVSKRVSRYFDMGLTAYFSEGSNMIQSLPNPALGHALNVNTGSFRNKGIEVSAGSQPLDNLTIKATYSYLYTSLNNLTAAPKNQYFLGVSWMPIKKFMVDAQLKGVGGLYVADNVEHQNYALLNMKLTYMPAKWVDIFATVDNITNADYVVNYGYDMPGVTAMGGFKVKF